MQDDRVKELEEKMGILERAVDVLRSEHNSYKERQEERYEGMVKQHDEVAMHFGKVDRGQQKILFGIIAILGMLVAGIVTLVLK